jgi:hypothetical protein
LQIGLQIGLQLGLQIGLQIGLQLVLQLGLQIGLQLGYTNFVRLCKLMLWEEGSWTASGVGWLLRALKE